MDNGLQIELIFNGTLRMCWEIERIHKHVMNMASVRMTKPQSIGQFSIDRLISRWVLYLEYLVFIKISLEFIR